MVHNHQIRAFSILPRPLIKIDRNGCRRAIIAAGPHTGQCLQHPPFSLQVVLKCLWSHSQLIEIAMCTDCCKAHQCRKHPSARGGKRLISECIFDLFGKP